MNSKELNIDVRVFRRIEENSKELKPIHTTKSIFNTVSNSPRIFKEHLERMKESSPCKMNALSS